MKVSIDVVVNHIYHIHDIECNQRYGEGKNLPYSFHLKAVLAQAKKYSKVYNIPNFVLIAAAGHDLIEDARQSYNDVKSHCYNGSREEASMSADIIYACSEEKGKTRGERHSNKFFAELSENRYAVYVKLCDIMANVLYSRLFNSSMYEKYQSEFPGLKEKLYKEGEYDLIWKDLEESLGIL